MSIDKAWMARVKEVVDWCLANDLKVIINTHHDKWLEGLPTYQHQEENNQKLALLEAYFMAGQHAVCHLTSTFLPSRM